jgi:hypothetical protein
MININKIVKELVTESLLQQKNVLEKLSQHKEFLKKQFLIDCLQELNIKTLPKLIFTKDKSKTETLGHNNLTDNQIVVFTMGRNMADCFRTISHELVHSKQNCDGRIEQNSGDTGSDIENEANSQAGIFLRGFGKKYPEIYELSFDNELNEEGNYDKYQTLLKIRYPTHSSEGNYANDREKIYNQTVEKGGNIDTWNRIVANDQNRFLEEEKINKDEYSCLMLDVPFQNWQKVLSRISKEDLYEKEDDDTYGLKEEPQSMVLYGLLKGFKEEKLINFIKDFCKSTPIEIEIVKMGVFKHPKFDVLKFDVESPALKSLNKNISKNFSYKPKFPKFEPHITIAYLKKGTYKKYLQELKSPVTKSLTNFVYSKPDESKTKFKID